MQKNIAVIGASIMDVMGFPDNDIEPNDSTPGKVIFSQGGVGRNIAENLSRLGLSPHLFSVFGDDSYSSKLASSITAVGGSLEHSLFLTNQTGAIFLAIMNKNNDLAAGIAAMEGIRQITPEYLAAEINFLHNMEKVVVETNIPKISLEWIAQNINKEALCIDLVSAGFAGKVKDIIGSFGTVKANLKEAAIFLGREVETKEDVYKAADILLDKGCQQVFITMGKEGVLAANLEESEIFEGKKVKIANTTGAGDAFLSGVVFGQLEGLSLETCTKYGIAAAIIALESEYTVSPLMSRTYLLEKV